MWTLNNECKPTFEHAVRFNHVYTLTSNSTSHTSGSLGVLYVDGLALNGLPGVPGSAKNRSYLHTNILRTLSEERFFPTSAVLLAAVLVVVVALAAVLLAVASLPLAIAAAVVLVVLLLLLLMRCVLLLTLLSRLWRLLLSCILPPALFSKSLPLPNRSAKGSTKAVQEKLV
jgi:hypothetical protein